MLKDAFIGVGTIDTPKGDVKVSLFCAVPIVTKYKGSTYSVKLPVSHAKYPASGYIYEGSKLHEILTMAQEKGERVLVRVEKQRKKGIDPSLKIDDLTVDLTTAQKNVVTAMVGVYDFSSNKWIIEGGHSNPENDPETVKAFLVDVQNGTEDVNAEKFFEQQKPKIIIPNPQNFDYQQQLLTMYYFIKEKENAYEYELTEDQRRDFAKRILRLADEIQKLIKLADIVDYKDYSHTRARYLIFSYESNFANLNKDTIVNINEWIKNAYGHAKDIINWTNS